ncbi:acyl transferase domain-containing protein/enoyl-CoA hydratase/carnithine racemase/pimeloyl-ACP methyl ester carboxylesterase/tryptophanase/acyl carrier protein [Micromonospora luteifusca]|uniref:Acyl transferase domain-containing protein/enoyl-CoA hydratase/carnithine racemase/pimeloyl-ACP methyl ester carboxylesterase/tryptophanase/acyl carrier protein n=1 Tax=Micromonospora luteifusca TaxID=709860 RepID=A0ABS2M152_9ACTN|nr:SDR family NAD(P)-dependent oxidoreductase [Micromonospora luteifusca]MBM7494186.1 acyl transferase domain-containing protein/enoyl-CoA hydratase/carnithine racemase/pimeloyl-ACP methyl ester carboxylesterase/tryptophanase/acyl carrier protein [Micromonospora luteifusca]
MPVPAVSSRLTVSHTDFVMRNHRVHDVSVLPGVALLDVLYRALAGRGVAPESVVVRDVLFTEPIATDDGYDREVHVHVDPSDADEGRVTITSRRSRDGQPVGSWRPNMTARVHLEHAEDDRVDTTALLAGQQHVRDVDDLYVQARSEDIVHGAPMQAFGAMYLDGERLVADLSVHASTREHADLFHLHPALLDASTLVAFARTPVLDAPFIPISIEMVRIPRPGGRRCLVHVPQRESHAPSGDVMHNSYRIHDPDGGLVAEFTKLTCKRIRQPGLITNLVGGTPSPRTSTPAPRSDAEATSALDAIADAYVEHLRVLVGRRLDRPTTEVSVTHGFYDQGLDSVSMLAVSDELQAIVNGGTYPTLLFEFGTITELAQHLAAAYGPPVRPAPPAPVASAVPSTPTVAAPATTLVARRVWRAAPMSSPSASPPLLILATDSAHAHELLGALPAGDRGVEVVHAGPDGRYLSAAALDEHLTALRGDDTGTVAVCVLDHHTRPETDAARAHDLLRSVAAALLGTRPTRPIPLHYLAYGGPGAQARQAVAALARTIAAETPVLVCRTVLLDAEEDIATLAGIVNAETGHTDHTEVRHTGGFRETPALEHLTADRPSRLRRAPVCLVTGGGGRLARLLTAHLIERYDARVVLVGRSDPDEDLTAAIAAWRSSGGQVQYTRADVTDAEELAAAVELARIVYGRLHAVFHLAGVIDDVVHFRKQPAQCAPVLAPKVDGVRAIEQALADEPAELLVFFSSLSSVIANPGQSDYAFANAYLDHRAAADPLSRLSISWPHWVDGGMGAVRAADHHDADLVSLTTDAGLAALDLALRSSAAHVVVAHGAPSAIERVLHGNARPHDTYGVDAPGAVATGGTPSTPPERTQTPSEPSRGHGEPVAVIGMSGRYPAAADLREFWRNLAEERDCVTEVPTARWDHTPLFNPDRGAPGRTYSRWGGFLDHIDQFSPAFFGISRREAEYMDPQERLFLTESWRALEDAGYPPETLTASRVGVFAGVMWNHYQLLRDEHGVAPTALHSAIANRVSYCFGLTGPSLAVDTACSSSLVAVHLAVESIRRGESDVALAGGVNLAPHPQKYLQLAADRFLSDDGRCRAFGSGGTGYVPGEGVGVVVLKPLARAVADGDAIAGVIIGSAVNHNGRTSGFTVPAPGAQAALIRAALADAGVPPASVTYLEAHGTGTSVGDPIEIAGLHKAFTGVGAPPVTRAVGSVKSNIGHLEAAAGVAGLSKVLLQIRHRQLVASLHATPANEHIDFASTGITVQTRTAPWQSPDGVLRAGVSAFGAGGTNAHVIVQSPPHRPRHLSRTGQPELILLSAPDEATLKLLATRLRTALTDQQAACVADLDVVRAEIASLLGLAPEDVDPNATLADLGLDPAALTTLGRLTGTDAPLDVDLTIGEFPATAPSGPTLADIAHTLSAGRRAMRARAAVVVTSVPELLDRLRELAELSGTDRWMRGLAPEEAPSDPEIAELLAAGDLREVASRWVRGARLTWPSHPRGGRRISLPATPLPEERCWLGAWAADRRDKDAPPRTTHPEGPVDLTVTETGIALVTMRDEANRNMFSDALLAGLEESFTELARRDDVRVVVLTGGPPVFCMGGEPGALAELAAKNSTFTDASFVYEGLITCPLPVIAAVGGHAAGGGLAFPLYADLVVLSRSATYAANFLKYGFTPGMGATHILAHRFGRALATEMLLTGRAYAGDELERRGAQVRFADAADVLPSALNLAHAIAAMPGRALRELKAELARPTLDSLPSVIEVELAMHDRVLGEDAVQLVRDRLGSAVTPAHPDHRPAQAPHADLLGADTYRPAVAQPLPAAPVVPAAPAMVDLAPLRPPTATSPVLTPAPPAAHPSVRRDEVLDVVVRTLADQLYLDRSELDASRTFSDMGLDSIGAVDVVLHINRAFGTDIESVAVYDHPTIERLTEHVLTTVAARQSLVQSVRAEPRPSAPGGGAPAAAAPTLAAPHAAQGSTIGLAPVTVTDAPVRTPPEHKSGTETRTEAGRSRTDTSDARPGPTSSAPEQPPAGGQMDIAVIGMSGQWPGAGNLDEFWANLSSGHSAIAEVGPARWDVDAVFDTDPTAEGRTYSRWAAMLDEVDSFDHRFFNMSPLEAAQTDPQQRLFLTEAWRALEAAGYAGDAVERSRCGVFVGCAPGDYADQLRASGKADTASAFLGGSSSILAARIAYQLDLRGPAVAVDTACSSSLVAVHLAAQSLRTGETDVAVAGGVALMLTPSLQVRSSQVGMLSPTGTSAPFDASADGIVLGEGVGVVVLKRLTDAVRDGDQVLGVIKASGVNGDGRTNGITAPSADSQAALLRRVHADAGVNPEDITYVEAHGTGTPLGDPIEFAALRRVLGAGGAGDQAWCALGSVKGNIGHTTMAAGVAGLIKVLLQLRHGEIAPTANYAEANPKIDFSGSPLFPVPAGRPWPVGRSGTRIATVSSFGFSGTNCHLVVGQAPPPRPRSPQTARAEAVVLSARTDAERSALVRDVAAALTPELALEDVAFTLARGRRHLRARAAVVAHDIADLRAKLTALARGDRPQGCFVATSPVAALGVGTLIAVTDAEQAARAFVEGRSMDWSGWFAAATTRRIPLPTYPFSPARHRPPTPAAPTTAAPQPAPDGAVQLDPRHPLVADHVIAGRPLLPGAATVALVADALARLREPRYPVRLTALRWRRPFPVDRECRLPVSLTPSAGGWTFTLGDPDTPHATGTVARPTQAAPVTLDIAALRRDCPDRVDVDALYQDFDRADMRYGATFRLLRGLCVGRDSALVDLHPPAAEAVTTVVDAAFQATAVLVGDTAGPVLPVATSAIHLHHDPSLARHAVVRRRGHLRFDIDLTDANGLIVATVVGLTLFPIDPLEGKVFVPAWRPAGSAPEASPATGDVVVFCRPAGRPLAEDLLTAQPAANAVLLPFAAVPPPGWEALVATVERIHLIAEDDSDQRPGHDHGAGFLLGIVRSLLCHGRGEDRIHLTVVTDAAVGASPDERVRPHAAALIGLTRTIAAEQPAWRVTCLDVGADTSTVDAAAIAAEDGSHRLVALRDGRRLVRSFVPTTPAKARPPYRPGVYLVVGGACGIGHVVSRHLARSVGATLVWLGRREAGAAIRRAQADVGDLGGHAVYVRGDVADPASVAAALAEADRHGELVGVFHSAGVLRDRRLGNLTDADLQAALAPKVAGSVTLAAGLAGRRLQHLVFFSSAASFIDADGQANYAAASTFQDAYATSLRRSGLPATVINWGYWGSTGAVSDDRHRSLLAADGIRSLDSSLAMEALDRILAAGIPQALVIDATPAGLAHFGIGGAPAAAPAAPARPMPTAVPTTAAADPVDRRARVTPADALCYVRGVFAEVLGHDLDDLDEHSTFEEFGVDSIIGTRLLDHLTGHLGPLPSTLLFEETTLARLAARLLADHPEAMVTRLAPSIPDHPVSTGRSAGTSDGPSHAAIPRAAAPDEPIAVIAVDGRYPGAPDLTTFWANLAAGRRGISEVPAERWDWRQTTDPQRGLREYQRWGGFLDDVAGFDAALFGVLPKDAVDIDPQERLFLQTCWTVLENAGYLGERHEPSTGVFAGAMYGGYGELGAMAWVRGSANGAHSAYWSIANRVSYTLDLSGPSLAVDTACSSSLTAVHLACESIRRGECRMALAGGVNLIAHPLHHIALGSRNMLAADGQLKVFDDRADGYVPGEGVGAVLLKGLADAIADGDTIWAVVRGSAVNAGGKTSGYTVPNPHAQGAVVAAALRRAGVRPRDIGYIEAHGSGTELGDPIEIAGLSRAFSLLGDAPEGCAVGSVKANIGHLEGAAGIAGLTKVLLQLRHRTLVQTASLHTPNPKIDFGGIAPVRATGPWPARPSGAPRTACVSSFGAGGANTHLVVEEYVAAPTTWSPSHDEHLVVLSAPDASRLVELAGLLAEQQQSDPAPLAALACTSQTRRRAFRERLAVICADVPALVTALRAYVAGEAAPGLVRTGDATAGDLADALTARDLSTLAALWVAGTTVPWSVLWSTPTPPTPLPNTPLRPVAYWIDEHDTAPRPTTRVEYERRELSPGPLGDATFPIDSVLIVGAVDCAVRAQLRDRMLGSGVQVTVAEPETAARIAAELVAAGRAPAAVTYIGRDHVDGLADPTSTFHHVLETVVVLLTANHRPRVVCARVSDHPEQQPHLTAMTGMLRTLTAETGCAGICVASDDPAAAAGQILGELRHGTDDDVEHRAGRRLVGAMRTYRPVPARPGWVRPDGAYLVTGGAGALGLHIAALLAARGATEIILLGRSALTADQADRISALRRPGVTVRHLRCDVADPAALAQALADARRHRPLRGIVHCAGVIRDARLVDKTPAQIAEVLAPKLTGTLALDQATAEDPLDFFVLFSSVAATVGNPGQVDYSYANAFLDAFASTRTTWVAAGRRRGHTLSIGWPLWADGGMGVPAAVLDRLRSRFGMVPMTSDTATAVLETLLAGRDPAVVVVEKLVDPEPSTPLGGPPAAAAPPRAVPFDASRDTHQPDALEPLRDLAASFLLVDAKDVDIDTELMDLGFDSISMSQLTEQINRIYDLEILPTVLFEHPTLAALAGYLHTERRATPAADAAPTTSTASESVRDIAVVGMAGIMPKSPDLDTFWRHLAAGHDLVRHVPEDREALLADPRTRHLVGGFLDQVGEFDATLFGISPKEAALMDPQQRLFLHCVWSAIANAGHATASLAGTLTGLFVGVSTHDYEDLMTLDGIPVRAHMATGLSHAVLANRVSHLLDLRGPSEAVDTACSSSLVALHRAVRALRSGECDTAIVGGVSVLLTPGLFTAFTEAGMLSPHGRCATFDKAADGYVRGEGAGAVVLKSLARALADGDHVHAVIRGSAVNHGGRAASLTAPNPRAQAEVLTAAHRDAGLDPDDISYLEAHGTGTRLGDPVEIEGIKKAFPVRRAGQQLAVGSVKTNIGHLEAAAGIAGLLKALLALRHRHLPPHLHLSELNPHIRLAGTSLTITDQLTAWQAPVLRAGISSFGFGGTNAHVVVEQPPTLPAPAADGPLAFPLSAPDPARLADYASRLAEHISTEPVDLASVAYTLQTGRDGHPSRLVVHTADRADLVAALRAAARRVDHPAVTTLDSPQRQGLVAQLVHSFLTGHDVAWDRQWAVRPRRAPLPTFALARTTYWYTDAAAGVVAPSAVTRGAAAPPASPRPSLDNGHRAAAITAIALEPAPASTSLRGRNGTGSAGPHPNGILPVEEHGTRGGGGQDVSERIRRTIRSELVDLLGLDPSTLTDDGSLRALGLDSIFTLDLTHRLTDALGPVLDAAQVYDHDSVDLLTGMLTESLGNAPVAPVTETAVGDNHVAGQDGDTVIDKRDLAADPALAATVASLDASYGVESGLAGRDIAPVLFVPADHSGYVEFAWSERAALVWGYTGPEEARIPVVDRFAQYMTSRARRVNVLSPVRLTELAGQPCTATPFGVVQHLTDLTSFTIEGGRMRRLRGNISKFTRQGAVDVTEYRPGTHPATDAAIVGLVDEWTAGKKHVNRYVSRVRSDLARGALPDAHRLFLTRLNGDLMAAVVVTRMASEFGYLLDVEFYRRKMPLGGLEFTIVHIIDTVRAEGATIFSFGATFGVQVGQSDNASPAAVRALSRLSEAGVSGAGNYQFKSKFRPIEMPIYLCQPVARPSSVEEVLLMIASPEQRAAGRPASTDGVTGDDDRNPDRRHDTALKDRPSSAAQADSPLAAADWNVLRLSPDVIGVDLITDSWAERQDPWIATRQRKLLDSLDIQPDRMEVPWLPFPTVLPTASGRAAERLLCRAWAGRRGVVLHNGVFPTWLVALAESRFSPVALVHPPAPEVDFAGDLPLAVLDAALVEHAEQIAFVVVEPGANACGGEPMSLANLRSVAQRLHARGVPLVLDATRLLDNVAAIVEREAGQVGRDPWAVLREMASLADALTLSLSKDFGLASGGLIATRDPALGERIRADQALHGADIGRLDRALARTALRGADVVWDGVLRRCEAVRALRGPLTEAGLPVVGTDGAHCVLLDVAAMPRFAELTESVASFLAWLYDTTGVRGGPHLSGGGAHPSRDRCVRLAVPVGMDAVTARRVGRQIATAASGTVSAPNLTRESPPGVVAQDARYRPVAASLPTWFGRQLTELGQSLRRPGYTPGDDNLGVLREICPAVACHLLEVAEGTVEVFEVGSGPTLVLMHPFNVGAGMFAPQLAGLADRFRVIVIHQPGVGRTRVPSALTLDGVAELQRAVLAERGITEPVHVGGASVGSIFAEYYTLRYPEQVLSLSLLGGSYKFANRKGRIDKLAEVLAEDFGAINDGGGRIDPATAAELTALLLRCESMDPKTGLKYLSLFTEQDLSGRLPDISVPTLVVQGRHDSVVGVKTGHFMHGAIPDARYVELPNSGHFVCFTDAERVNEELTGFLIGATTPVGSAQGRP